MKKVIEFLLGESDLDGYYFGESPKRKPFFWRTHLRAEWKKQQARISELEQREEELAATVERMKAQQSEVAARAVEDAVMNTPTHKMKVDERLYHSQKALLDYAKQLREQGNE